MSVKAVTFDCWGTLIVDRDMSVADAHRVQAVVEASDGRLTADQARELTARAWRVHHDAWVGGEQHGSPGMAQHIAGELGLADGWIERLTAAFEDASLHAGVDALPGAGETLRALREAGVRTALVCDTGFTPGRIVRRFLEEHGLAEHLEFLAFSNEVGVPKPDPRIFRHALEALDVQPAEAVHVGDLLRTDIAGAKALGMRTVRITAVNATGTAASYPGRQGPVDGGGGPEADAVVGSHSDLLEVLRSLGAPL